MRAEGRRAGDGSRGGARRCPGPCAARSLAGWGLAGTGAALPPLARTLRRLLPPQSLWLGARCRRLPFLPLGERTRGPLCAGAMASGRRGWDSSHEDDLPVYLARPGTTDQVPRQKYGGMFCNVEGAFESKTLDFDALSVGQRGAKTPRSSQGSGRGSASRPGVEGDSPRRGQGREEGREPAPASPASPAPAGVEIRSATGKEVLQNLGPKDKVRRPGALLLPPLFPWRPGAPRPGHNFLPLTSLGHGGQGGGKRASSAERAATSQPGPGFARVPRGSIFVRVGPGCAGPPPPASLPHPRGQRVWVGVSARPAAEA